MSGSAATVFAGPGGNPLPVVNANGQIYEEVQIATLNQVLFTLLTFTYTAGTKTINVFKNGLRLRRGTDYTETSTTQVTLITPCAAGDTITFTAYAVSQILAPLQNNGVIPAGANGQVLAKSSGSDYALQWLSLSSIATLLDQPVQNVASAPTVDVTGLAAQTRNILITGNTQIDGWSITAGQVFVVKFQSSLQLSNNISQVTPTGSAIKVGPNDSCLVRATANNVVEILCFSKSTSIIPPQYNDHRLSINSLQPVPTADNASGALYYTAYKGTNISLYNGTAWVVRQFVEASIPIAGLISPRPYDVFCYDNNGTPTLEILAWATNSARATALVRQDGVYVKNGDPTRKFIGTFAPTAGNVVTDSARQRLVWNMYNRVRRNLAVKEAAASWNYSVANWHQVNGNPNNQVETVVGLVEDNIELQANSSVTNTVAGTVALTGIGLDITTGSNANISGRVDVPLANAYAQAIAKLSDYAQLGYHQYVWVEYSGGGATTWSGTSNSSAGITGSCMA